MYSLVMPLGKGVGRKKGSCLLSGGSREVVWDGARSTKKGKRVWGWGIFWRPSRAVRFHLREARGEEASCTSAG